MTTKTLKLFHRFVLIASIIIILLGIRNYLINHKFSQDEYYSFDNLFSEYHNKSWNGTFIKNDRHFAMVTDEKRLIMVDYTYQDENGLYYQVDYPFPLTSREYVIKSDENGTYIIAPEDGTLNYWSNGKLVNSWNLPNKNSSGTYYGYDIIFTENGPYLSYNYMELFKVKEDELILIADDINRFNLENEEIPSYIDQAGNVHDFTGQIDNTIYVPSQSEWVPLGDNIIQWDYYSLYVEWKKYEWDGSFKITDNGLCVCVQNDILFVNGIATSYFNYEFPIDYLSFKAYSSYPYNVCSASYFITYDYSMPLLMHFEHGNCIGGAILPHDGKWKIGITVNSCQKLELLGSDEEYYYDPDLNLVFRHES